MKRKLTLLIRDMSEAEVQDFTRGFEEHVADSVRLRTSLLPLSVPQSFVDSSLSVKQGAPTQ